MFRTFLASAVLVVGCKSSEGGADMDLDNKGSGSAKGSATSGFSAELTEPAKDAGAKAAVKTPDKVLDKGSAVTPEKVPDKGSAAVPDKAGTGSAAGTGTGTGTGAGAGAGAGAGTGTGTGAGTGSGAGTGAGKPVGPIPTPPVTDKPRVPAKVPPELAAIKLSLDPNWDRDVGDAGTISFVLKKPSGDQAIFSFTYGYDDPKAPVDRDAYMKWLGEQKLLTVELNRQRGSAWYLQGTDATGAPAFRYLVNYGGRHLICGGLLYKDAESSKLGDLRDKVIIQAKEICETLAL